MLSVAGVVGGVGAAAMAAGMAAIYRYQLGGIGATVGVMVVLVSAVLGVLARAVVVATGRSRHPPCTTWPRRAGAIGATGRLHPGS